MKAKEQAKAMSRERVYKTIRGTVNNLEKQLKLNKEAGLGEYEPSATERLARYIMRAELQQKADRNRRLEKELDQPLNFDLNPAF
jgi:hypothetical protein